MTHRSIARLIVCLFAAFLVAADVPSAFGSGEPQDSFLYQNFVRASAVLDRAVAAHGGDKLLDRTLDIRISFTGTLVNEGHFARPWAQLDYPLEGSLIYSAELRAVKSAVTEKEDQSLASFTIVGLADGLRLAPGRVCKDRGEWEQPAHRVVIDAFSLDRYEVTNALFERFVAAKGYRTTARFSLDPSASLQVLGFRCGKDGSK